MHTHSRTKHTRLTHKPRAHNTPRLGSTLHMQLRGDKPHVIGPLCAAVQMLNVSRPGEEPDLATATEDTRLLLGEEAMQGALVCVVCTGEFVGGCRCVERDRNPVEV